MMANDPKKPAAPAAPAVQDAAEKPAPLGRKIMEVLKKTGQTLLAVLAVLILLFIIDLEFLSCKDVVIKEVTSPDDTRRAVVFTTLCGGAAGNVYTGVSVLKSDGMLWPFTTKNGLVFDTLHGSDIDVEWLTADELIIKYGTQEGNIKFKPAKSGGLTLIYQPVKTARNSGNNKKQKEDVFQTPQGASIDKNVSYVRNKKIGAFGWMLMTRPGGQWDYKQFGARYEDFSRSNYLATGKAAGISEKKLKAMEKFSGMMLDLCRIK